MENFSLSVNAIIEITFFDFYAIIKPKRYFCKIDILIKRSGPKFFSALFGKYATCPYRLIHGLLNQQDYYTGHTFNRKCREDSVKNVKSTIKSINQSVQGRGILDALDAFWSATSGIPNPKARPKKEPHQPVGSENS